MGTPPLFLVMSRDRVKFKARATGDRHEGSVNLLK